MDPIKVKESNFTYRGPTPDIMDLPCHVEGGDTFSMWMLSDAERAQVVAGANIRMGVHGQHPIPPVSLQVVEPTGPYEPEVNESQVEADRRDQQQLSGARHELLEAKFAAIDELRAEEGSSVEICCSNPEGDGKNNEKVIATGCWTNWEPREFTGPTVLSALIEAVKTKASWVPT